MKLSKYFTAEEFTQSGIATRRGLDNTPPPATLTTLQYTATCMDRLVVLFKRTIHINSAYRSPAINKAVGSGSYSQHLTGEAVDFTMPGISLRDAFDLIRTAGVPYDQLIYEGDWLHISFTGKRQPRGSTLVAVFAPGKRPVYHVPNWTPKPYSPAAPSVPEPTITANAEIVASQDSVEVSDHQLPSLFEPQAQLGECVYKSSRVPSQKRISEHLPGSPELFTVACGIVKQRFKAWIGVIGGFSASAFGIMKTKEFWLFSVIFILFCLMVWYLYGLFKKFHEATRKV